MKDNHVAAGLWLALGVGGILYGGVQGTLHSIEKKHAEERAASEAARAQVRESINEKMRFAIMAGQQGRFADAVRMFEALADLYPKSAAIHLNLGIAYRGNEQLEEAKQALDRVLAIDAEDWDAVAEKATVLLLQEDAEAAFALMETVPPREGRMPRRLSADPTWLEVEDQARLAELRKKHGVEARADTSRAKIIEMERRRRAFEKTNPKRPR